MRRIISYFINGVLIGLVILVAFLFLGVKAGIITPEQFPRPYVIYSGSMEPSIKTGSVILTLPSKTYSPGEIISYSLSDKAGDTVTHRIEFKLYPSGVNSEPVFITSGDANKTFDQKELRQKDIIGKVVFTAPYLGYLVDFAKKPWGFILLVIVPVTIIIYEELRFLKGELLKLAFKGQSFKGSRTINPETEDAGISKATTFIPLIGAALVLTGVSASFFSDIEQSTGNVFTAGEWGPPIANYLVINEVLYEPNRDQTPGGQGGSNRGEFVEIYNPTESSADLTNWVLNADGSNVNLPSFTLPAGNFLIISGASKEEIQTIYGVTLINFFQTSGGKVGNGFDDAGGYIQLLNSSATVVDQLSYGNDTSVFNPPITDYPTGHSFERDPDGVDTNTAGDFVDKYPPTPGS